MPETKDPKPETKDCSTCRHHSKIVREEPIWFENQSEQMRTVDVNALLCNSPTSEHRGKSTDTPICCDAYEAGSITKLPPVLASRMDAALARLKARGDESR